MRLKPSSGKAPASAEVIFVGEAARRSGRPRRVIPLSVQQESCWILRLREAGIDRTRVYVTNSVKHFKFVLIERGRRLHKKPNAGEIRACNPWLREEIRLLKPRVIVALGATAAQVLLGKQFRVTQQRGKAMPSELAEADHCHRSSISGVAGA